MVRSFKQYDIIDEACEECIFEHEAEGITESEYQGKKVKLNDPIRGGSKKFYVYVKNEAGKVIKVSFGEMIRQEENLLELGTIVIIQALKQKHDIGLVINGEQEQR